MEKEKLSNDLKGLVGQNSLSERTWGDYIDNSVLPFVPEDETKVSDFLAKHAAALKSLNGQISHDVASKVDEFKKSYKPEPPKPADPPKQPGDEKPEWAKELEAKLAKIESEKTEAEKAATKQKLLSEAQKLMKDQGADNETVIELITPLLKVEENQTAADLAAKGKALYDDKYKKLFGDGYNPASGGGSGSANKKASNEAYRKHLEETGRIKKQN